MSTSTRSKKLRIETRNRKMRENFGKASNYILMTALAFFFMFPLIIMIVSSFKPNNLVTDDMDSIYAFIPRELTLGNYSCPDFDQENSECSPGLEARRGLFESMPYGRIYFNTVFITGSVVLGGLLFNSMAAFAMSRLEWRGKRLAVVIVIALIIIPFESIAVPLLFLVDRLPWIDGTIGWLNTYHVQIIPFMADAFSIFLFYQFFRGIPKDFDEAAYVDGANPFRVYWQVIVPLARPVFATVAILQSLAIWGSYLWPLMATASSSMDIKPLPVAIGLLFGTNDNWGAIMAFATLATIPILIIFIMFQKWFIQSIASSGVKG